MPEENQGVPETSPSPLAAAIASSPEALEEQTQETQTPPAQEGVTQEPVEESRIPYSRLKEVVDEKNWYKQQLERKLQESQSQQQFQQPAQPPQELGNTPEEREFYRLQRQIAREEAEKVFGRVTPIIDAGRMELVLMKVQQFRTQHSDVRPNSPEEVAIAEKIQMGYLPEDAYRSVMWDKKVGEKTEQLNQSNRQKIEAKKSANVEQRSIPNNAIPPTKEKLTLRQRIERNAQEAGI